MKRPVHRSTRGRNWSPRQDREWIEICSLADDVISALPEDLRTMFARISNEICDAGDARQIPPMHMAAAAAAIIASLAMAHVGGNVHADQEIDDFLDFCHAAMHVGSARARIKLGWRPEGPQ